MKKSERKVNEIEKEMLIGWKEWEKQSREINVRYLYTRYPEKLHLLKLHSLFLVQVTPSVDDR
jgi:hypothetical protein